MGAVATRVASDDRSGMKPVHGLSGVFAEAVCEGRWVIRQYKDGQGERLGEVFGGNSMGSMRRAYSAETMRGVHVGTRKSLSQAAQLLVAQRAARAA